MFAIWRQADVGRAIAQQRQRESQRDDENGDDQGQRRPPAPMFGNRGQQRQEDELTGGVAGGQQADGEAAAGREPTRRHRRAEHQRRHAGAEPDDHAPEQLELQPELFWGVIVGLGSRMTALVLGATVATRGSRPAAASPSAC